MVVMCVSALVGQCTSRQCTWLTCMHAAWHTKVGAAGCVLGVGVLCESSDWTSYIRAWPQLETLTGYCLIPVSQPP